jgi:guanine deaminase
LLQPLTADECRVTRDARVRIGDDGRIAEVSSGGRAEKNAIGGEGCWILPGFIDAHLHLPQWDRRGIDGLSLFDWHEQVVYPAEARLKDANLAARLAEDFVGGLLARGTTTVAAFSGPFADATSRAFEVFAKKGIRAVFGMILNDVNCPKGLCQKTDEALDASRLLAAKWHGAENGRLSYAFSPRMPVCCSEKMMRGAAALADMLKCYIQTHVAESLAEVAAVREKFPDQLDDVDVFAEMGLLTSRTLLGHGVYLNQQQRKQVAEARATVVHCPTANLFLESGLMDYAAHRASGVKMALGSSVAAGPDPFMPRVAVECLQTARAIRAHAIRRSTVPLPAPSEAWWLITRGAAEALGMGDRIGVVDAGYEADCVVVRPEPWISELPEEQQVSALLYTLRVQQIENVFVAGRRVGP